MNCQPRKVYSTEGIGEENRYSQPCRSGSKRRSWSKKCRAAEFQRREEL